MTCRTGRGARRAEFEPGRSPPLSAATIAAAHAAVIELTPKGRKRFIDTNRQDQTPSMNTKGGGTYGEIVETCARDATQLSQGCGRGCIGRCRPACRQRPGRDQHALAEHLAVEGHIPRIRA